MQGKTSHKFIDMNENPIMHIYYTNRMVLGFMCLFNELFYAALYLLYFTPGPICKSNFVSFSSGNFKFYCMEFGIVKRLHIKKFSLITKRSAKRNLLIFLTLIKIGIKQKLRNCEIILKHGKLIKPLSMNKPRSICFVVFEQWIIFGIFALFVVLANHISLIFFLSFWIWFYF